MTDSQPSGFATLDELAWAVRQADELQDYVTTDLAIQIVMLEEALAARWPRRILAMRRWRRDVRESVRAIGGSTWMACRLNALGTDWLTRPGAPGEPWGGHRAR